MKELLFILYIFGILYHEFFLFLCIPINLDSVSHVNSFKRGDALTQSQDEWNIQNILLQDEEFLQYLREDDISLEEKEELKYYQILLKSLIFLLIRLDEF